MRRALWCVAVATLLSSCDLGRPLRVIETPRDVERIEITPPAGSVAVGESLRFSAMAYGSGDRPLPEVPVYWGVGNPSVLTQLDSGVVVGRAAGSSEVIAAAGGRTASVVVSVR